ncbi:MAG: sulfurtransferase complex subunit TusD [Gammaproteobacteria bacterium]|jgi:tRNA 2-thiouridine synthesizing protein D|nr:sulfurtransferase complex subunit TusD [Gammaproteobacteria bacterium]MBT7370781.1 sulfurtransferase complex subunit TusD [Gammaproteobacteria bacterium]
MKFSIVVYGAPYSSEGCLSALKFAESVITNGHEIVRVFFYQDGVYTANVLIAPPQDEIDISQAWGQFGIDHDIELIACIASCLRRGILDETEASRYEKRSDNLRAGFTISGLGQLIDASLNADRVVTFGA